MVSVSGVKIFQGMTITSFQRTRGGDVCMLISKEFKTIQIQLQDTPVEVDMLCVDLLFSQPYRIFVVCSTLRIQRL